jgi:hypothetical protein
MIDAWMLWILLVGIAIGLLSAWLVLGRLPRDETDVTISERRDEAAWIGHTIERHGGVAPQSLVEEVLQLHQAYLRNPSLQGRRSETDAYPVPPGPTRLPPSAPPPPEANA